MEGEGLNRERRTRLTGVTAASRAGVYSDENQQSPAEDSAFGVKASVKLLTFEILLKHAVDKASIWRRMRALLARGFVLLRGLN